jgi:hypothetical protein
MPRRRNKKQQRLQGEGFWDTITSWGRTLRDYPKLIVDGPKPSPPGSTSSEGLPDKSILKDIADNSYKGTSDEMKGIPGYTLKFKSPTLVIYQKDGENVMVIGVRGTADFRDFRAWFSTAFNVIPDSQRFKEDIAEISKFQQQYPLSAYTYYATGHSLGGTLIDELIKKGMVKEARTYNPAIETDDIPNVALSQKNHRIYADGDPLYLLQGRYDNPTEVRKSYKYYPSSAMDFIPGYDKYKQHILANPVFVGGMSNPFYHLRGAGMMANSQFYRTDPKRNPLLSGGDSMDFDNVLVPNDREPMEDDIMFQTRSPLYGNGIFDDIKSGIQSVVGKPPVSAHKVWTPAEQADINKRQRVIDVDKQREKMISSRVDYAFKNLMENAQRPNVLQGYYKSLGTDNVKDYTAKVKALATKAAEEFYPY